MSVYVIAEIGINHNGHYETAVKMIEAARTCDADAVKFQTYYAEDICDRSNPEFPWLEQCELSNTQFVGLRMVCERVGIDFISTPDTVRDAEFLDTLSMKYMKIGSANANSAFLNSLAHIRTPLLVSLGMGANNIELRRGQVSHFMHCISAYPVPDNEAEMCRVQQANGVTGFSDHTIGSMAAIMAVARGAKVIEKHFTLEKTAPGPDHHMSADPAELVQYIKDIRRATTMLWGGQRGIFPLPCEQKTIQQLARRKMTWPKK